MARYQWIVENKCHSIKSNGCLSKTIEFIFILSLSCIKRGYQDTLWVRLPSSSLIVHIPTDRCWAFLWHHFWCVHCCLYQIYHNGSSILIRKALPYHQKHSFFRCASISWFQAVSEWVIDVFLTASASTGLSELFNIVQIVVDLPSLHLEHFFPTFFF